MDHWTLGPIAVDPAHRGQGFASQLIRPMLERADDEGVPVYLSTNTEENIALYEHFGFKVKERADMPGVDGWNASMLREPQ
jgi:ribosomal protein S18 acetylase RimI-like enzyme